MTGVFLLLLCYSFGIGLSGFSVSHATDAIHHLFPSFTGWIALMPRTNGFSSPGAWRPSYVEKIWQTFP